MHAPDDFGYARPEHLRGALLGAFPLLLGFPFRVFRGLADVLAVVVVPHPPKPAACLLVDPSVSPHGHPPPQSVCVMAPSFALGARQPCHQQPARCPTLVPTRREAAEYRESLATLGG